MLKVVTSMGNDTNHDAGSCNTKSISIDNSTEDNADANLEDDVHTSLGHKNWLNLKLIQ